MAISSAAPRPPVDIDVLQPFLSFIESGNQDLVQDLAPGRKLCHYTTLDGACSILEGRDLWLTNTRFSNDDQELKYGQSLVDALLSKEAQAVPARAGFLQLVRDEVKAQAADQVYVCCFCETDNLLSQWRGYAENGGGASIEFDPVFFKRFSGPDSLHGLMRLWKVFYDVPRQESIIRACIDYIWPGTDEAERVRFTVDAIQFFIPTFKNPAFAQEEERRLIFTPREVIPVKPKFRTRRGVLLPYFSLQELASPTGTRDPVFDMNVKNVLIGPSHNGLLNVDSMNFLLRSNAYLNGAGPGYLEATLSPIPYRG